MKEIIKTIKVYDFEELSEEIQKKLIEEEKENIFESYLDLKLCEDLTELAKEILEQHFGKKAIFNKIYYSLSYCQGDGAMIEFEIEYYGKLQTIKQYGRHTHARSFIINGDFLGEKREKQLQEKIIKMNEDFTKKAYSYVEIDNIIDNESAIENLKQYQYTENGNIFE